MFALAQFVIHRRINSVLLTVFFAIASLFLTPLALLSSAIVVLNTLRKGYQEGILVVVISTVILFLVMWSLFQAPTMAFIMFLLWLGALLPATILNITRQLNIALMIILVIGVAGILFYFVSWSGANPAEIWQPEILKISKHFKEAGIELFQKEPEKASLLIAQFMLGVQMVMIFLYLAFSLFIGRWWQAKLYNQGGFQKEFHQLKFSKSLVIMSVIVFALTLLSDSAYLLALAMLFVLPLVFQGFAIIHSRLKKQPNAVFILTSIYITVIIVIQSILLIAAIGLADTWFHFREKQLK